MEAARKKQSVFIRQFQSIDLLRLPLIRPPIPHRQPAIRTPAANRVTDLRADTFDSCAAITHSDGRMKCRWRPALPGRYGSSGITVVSNDAPDQCLTSNPLQALPDTGSMALCSYMMIRPWARPMLRCRKKDYFVLELPWRRFPFDGIVKKRGALLSLYLINCSWYSCRHERANFLSDLSNSLLDRSRSVFRRDFSFEKMSRAYFLLTIYGRRRSDHGC